MKKLFPIAIILVILAGCNNEEVNVDTKTASDTMTNITNPGVGSAADDTTVHDNDTIR